MLLTPYLEGKQIVRKITSSPCCATLTLASKANTVTSNILAVKEAAVPSDEYVLIGAHRDSVFGAEGVNDNLSGTANVLGIAKALQNIDTDTNIIFALWGAEEDGLQGSKAFYNEVLAPENWGKEHITAYYNLDMAAPAQQRNRVLTIHTPYKDEAGNPLQSPAGDLAESNVARLYSISDLAGTTVWSAGPDDAADLQYFGNCSDHASISGANASPRLAYGEGIPSVYMFWGDRIGDGRNDVTEQNYHVPGDIYQWPADEDVFTAFGDSAPFNGNYDIRRAKILADVFALSVYNTADYPDLPGQDSVVSGDLNLNLPKIWSASVTLDKQPVELADGEVLSLAADDRTHTLELADTFGRSVSSTFHLESARAAALRQAADEAAAIAPENNGVFDPASKGALDAALSSARTLLESDAIVPEQIDDALKAIDDAKNSLGYRLFRVYNRNNGEHLYTIDRQEADALIDLGWSEEGVAWIAPVFGRALIRLYNPNSGEHHYTADPDEIGYLKSIGWQDEGEKWNSADSQSGVSIHRLYNPNAKGAQAAGAHHYTLSTKEKDALVRFGWNYENNDKAKIYALKG